MHHEKSQKPGGELVKEVYAHFGLCVFLSQVFETGLINILTTLANSSSKTPTRTNFDVLYEKHEALTFGNLMKGLKPFKIIPVALEGEIFKLKLKRDHLTHRFFRDHDQNFMTIGGCEYMVSELMPH